MVLLIQIIVFLLCEILVWAGYWAAEDFIWSFWIGNLIFVPLLFGYAAFAETKSFDYESIKHTFVFYFGPLGLNIFVGIGLLDLTGVADSNKQDELFGALWDMTRTAIFRDWIAIVAVGINVAPVFSILNKSVKARHLDPIFMRMATMHGFVFFHSFIVQFGIATNAIQTNALIVLFFAFPWGGFYRLINKGPSVSA